MSAKRYRDQSVYEAARERLRQTFEDFPKVYCSFSGGKDSGVMLAMALEVAEEMGRLPLDVLTVDLEGQYSHTIDYVRRVMDDPRVRGWWICLPLNLRNAVSQIQPSWRSWDPSAREAWIRDLPAHPAVISDHAHFPFFRHGMEFEEFVMEFGRWWAKGELAACLVGIRCDESLNRFRTLKMQDKQTWKGRRWTTRVKRDNGTVYNVYPHYDWCTEDVWIANGRFGYDYNRIYDLMHMAGLTIHQMRLCQPYGDDQRKGLYLFKILEPETWGKVVNRVEGANFGNRYAVKQSQVLGNHKIDLPKGHTYKSYAKFLLATMPPALADHYRAKIFTFLNWHRKNKHKTGMTCILDYADPRLEAQRKVASWRRVCKVLLKNDYWCRGLSFSQTKREMDRQVRLITRYMKL